MSAFAEYLFEDHAAFERLLCDSVARRDDFDVNAFACFRARILRHIDIEETFLLAPLTATSVPAQRLATEHRALQLLVRAPPSRRLVGEIRQILLLHMGAEEGPGGALEEHARLLGPDASRVIAERARAHPFRFAYVPMQVDVRTAVQALRVAEGGAA